MVIKETINIQDTRFIDAIPPILRIMDIVYKSPDKDIIIDFENTSYVTPLFLLSLKTYLKGCNKNIIFKNLNEYIKFVHFNDEIESGEMRISAFKAFIQYYTQKTYIPIISFPTNEKNDDIKNEILTVIEDILIKQAGISVNISIGLKYIIEESVDNITQHSESGCGYIFAQAYPKKHFVDICIADNGITLLGSYKKNGDFDIATDIEAMQAANRGISTKNLPEAENRGYGIITSKRMLTEGLDGNFIMISGTSLHIKGKSVEKFIDIPGKIRCPGTIVAIRVPYSNKSFNYIDYIE